MAVNRQNRISFDGLREQLSRQIHEQATPLDPKARAERVKACEGDLLKFIETYLPHYATGAWSGMHKRLASEYAPILRKGKKRGLRRADMAPRGNGKTTLNKGLLLQVVCYELKKFGVIIGANNEQSAEILEAVKMELEENPRLAMDFPNLVGVGPIWQQGEIVTRGGVKLKAYGAGKKVRGATHGVYRPDLALIDDLENDEQVRSPEQRDKCEAWLIKAVLPMGPPDGSMDLVMVGTVLHYDSVLVRMAKRPDFESLKFQAVLSWPTHMDLWAEFEKILWNESEKAARAFYEKHKKLMGEGSAVLWPKVQPLVELMLKRATSRTSFDSEYQNEPIDEKDRVLSGFHYYDELPPNLVCYGAIDPALGNSGNRGDFTSIIVLGVCPAGRIYVLEALIQRLKPHEAIERILDLHQRYQFRKFAVEIVQFQAFFKDELIRQGLEKGVAVPVVGVRPVGSKQQRIESLDPHIRNGVILFCQAHKLLMEQLNYFPMADHDDGPDALQMAFAIAQTSKGGAILSARPGLEPSTRFGGY